MSSTEKFGRTTPHPARLVAAMSSFIPLAFTWEQINKRLSKTQQKAIANPLVVTSFAFGTGFAACSDVKATIYAIVISAIFISMYDDLVGVVDDKDLD
jgi:hypothetical protein